MNCKEGDIVKVARATPKLEESWQALKDSKQLSQEFGVGSEVQIQSIHGEEATVLFKDRAGSQTVSLPALCLSCHEPPSGDIWLGGNKELKPATLEGWQIAPLPAITAEEEMPALDVQEEVPGQRACRTCGAVVSDVDTMCSVCGSMMPLPAAAAIPVSDEETEEIPKEEKACPSCGAIVEPGATECIICETPFEAVEPSPRAAEPEIERAVEENACPSCGAILEPGATECAICETPMAAVVPVPVSIKKEKQPEPEIQEMKEPEHVCESCGAILEPDATECLICDTPTKNAPVIAAAPVMMQAAKTEKQPSPKEAPPQKKPEPVVPEPKQETICAGCGAFLDEGLDECFICGTKAGEMPAEAKIPEPIPKAVPAQPKPVPKKEAQPEKPKVAEKAEPKVITLKENEIQCPSCQSVIPADSDKCPECWNDMSLYVRCTSCSKLTPAGEDSCRECFAPLEKTVPPAETEEDLDLSELGIPDLNLPDEVEMTEELQVEITAIETEEEQGKECLVCGAIFGPTDVNCPVCGIEYGVEIEEPKVPENAWDIDEVEVAPIIHTCPSCHENVTGLEATEREVNEGRWFYRGLVAIFIGIFFTSFSIYARGIAVENESLGFHPPPTDIILNLLGWILVLIGFVFWLMSWKLHGEKTDCPHCGIETDPNMAVCVNCGTDLQEEPDEDEAEQGEQVEEGLMPQEDEGTADQYSLLTEKPLQYDLPSKKAPEPKEDLTVPEPPKKAAEPPKKAPARRPEPAPAPPKKEETPHHGEELPVGHEEHKKCPGCGIFIDITDKVCPICDTEFAVPAPISDTEIEVPSEEEELGALKSGQSMDDITVPEKSGKHVECPSCGASLEAGTKACPVCEYPIDQ
ncbi:MAG: zinc ribbon domain-containing protein [Thermoplasmata archaeon]|nr:zinc ribbon domain-containing protein [Thermoplasmata archaeon]